MGFEDYKERWYESELNNFMLSGEVCTTSYDTKVEGK